MNNQINTIFSSRHYWLQTFFSTFLFWVLLPENVTYNKSAVEWPSNVTLRNHILKERLKNLFLSLLVELILFEPNFNF